MDTGLDLVTGAFGNTGSVIAALLQGDGRTVRTLTDHAPYDAASIDVRPFAFDDPDRLATAFDGVTTFYNTFWARTGGADGFDALVARSKALFDAAQQAGVQRIVHLSVANPSADSPYAYFRGKARVEQLVGECGVPSAIVRPALIFGGRTVLMNNLAWSLRRLPVFGVAAGGGYPVRPVHVDDVARLCVGAMVGTVTDAVGPERPTFRQLVTDVRSAVGGYARIVSMPTPLVLAAGKALGLVLRDDLLTAEELRSTVDGLADTDGVATGEVAVSEWLHLQAPTLGRRYQSERALRTPPSPSP